MIRIKGYVDEAGELHFDPPQGLEPGEVAITIEGELEDFHFEGKTNAEIMASGVFGAWADRDIEDSQAFVDELRGRRRKHVRHEESDELRNQAKTGAEIAASDVVGSWAHLEIEDSVEWVEKVRRESRKRRGL